MNPAPQRGARVNPREKRLKHYGSALRNLKSRLKNTFDQEGAG